MESLRERSRSPAMEPLPPPFAVRQTKSTWKEAAGNQYNNALYTAAAPTNIQLKFDNPVRFQVVNSGSMGWAEAGIGRRKFLQVRLLINPDQSEHIKTVEKSFTNEKSFITQEGNVKSMYYFEAFASIQSLQRSDVPLTVFWLETQRGCGTHFIDGFMKNEKGHFKKMRVTECTLIFRESFCSSTGPSCVKAHMKDIKLELAEANADQPKK